MILVARVKQIWKRKTGVSFLVPAVTSELHLSTNSQRKTQPMIKTKNSQKFGIRITIWAPECQLLMKFEEVDKRAEEI